MICLPVLSQPLFSRLMTSMIIHRTHTLILALLFVVLSFTTLKAQSDDSWKIYSDTSLARIDVTIDTSSLHWIYDHVTSDSEHYAQIRFRNSWIDETIDSIGFRLRGNTSRYSAKKSFKISFNSFIKGRRFHGVKKLNLNGEHNDPSIMRSKLSFDIYRKISVPASRASHARVYINGVYYGLYISVEDVGEDFLTKYFNDDSGNLWKCLYPADLQYLGDNPSTYAALSSGGRPVYELQTNETENDFSQLARLIRVINNTPSNSMADSLEMLLDIPTVLKYFAMNVLVGSWDDYRSLMNNYYLYYIPSENKFTLIPYDYDNSFGVDWSGTNWSTADPYNFPMVVTGPRPLSEALFAQNQYKNLFTHFLMFYNTNVMPLNNWDSRINRIRDTITSAAFEDTYRTLDYGFTTNDFLNSYSATSYSNQHVKFGLKQFISLRTASLPPQLYFTNAPPQAYNIYFTPANPDGTDSIHVYASCFGNAGIKNVFMYYTHEDSATPQVYPMKYTPVAYTTIVEEADRWTAVLPPLGWGVQGTIRIVVTDSLNHTQFSPRVNPLSIQSKQQALQTLFINELLADNTTIITDQNNEYDDWIELYNSTDTAILLTGKYMTDNPALLTKWRFTQTDLSIAPHGHLLVWCDDQTTQTGIHTNFKLSKSGEFAALTDTDGVTIIDSISFGAQTSNVSFGRKLDGNEIWETMTPTPNSANVGPNIVKDDKTTPREFSISAYPNPFNPVTDIQYTLPYPAHVNLTVFSTMGQEIRTLTNEWQTPGVKNVSFDAFGLSSGVYFYKLEAIGTNDRSQSILSVKKLLLLK